MTQIPRRKFRNANAPAQPPTPLRLPLAHPDEFAHWKQFGLGIGVVESGAIVRSSYHADEQSQKYTGFEHLNTHNALAGV